MNITFIGTAAAEGCPALFCKCTACVNARNNGGKDIRTRFQTLINDDLLIDFCPDTFMHSLSGNLDLDKVKNVIISHSHVDHFNPADICYRMSGYCGKRDPMPLNVYCNDACIEKMKMYLKDEENIDLTDERFLNAVSLNRVESSKEYNVDNYKVISYKADHKYDEDSLFYSVTDLNGKSILHAHDTGYFYEETWEQLQGKFFNLVSLDCTNVYLNFDRCHMGLEACARVKKRLVDMKSADEDTIFVVNHFSHNGINALQGKEYHEQLQKIASENNFIVAYDGMTVTI